MGHTSIFASYIRDTSTFASYYKQVPVKISNFNIMRVLVLFLLAALTCKTESSTWKTLDGSAPLVIAQGGFSGILPDSTAEAYKMATLSSIDNLVLWCTIQLTKDGSGICLPSFMLNDISDVGEVFPNRSRIYFHSKHYFTFDFTLKELQTLSLKIAHRPQSRFEDSWSIIDSAFQIQTVEDVFRQCTPQGYWLSIEDDAFYSQHNLSLRSFVISVSQNVTISHISSPDIRLLQGLKGALASTKTKLVLRFLHQGDKEPSTNQTYVSLLKNLTYIKSFASAILVPKSYIWPVDATGYLLPHTSLVVDGHKNGLQVFAGNFLNDLNTAYNYSFSPVAEYLSFIDDKEFSVDGVVSNYPATASVAIDCFAHLASNASAQEKPLVISNFGASGDYPGCTDLSYTAAISDGADIIDCPVQMSKEGVPFCLRSANLKESTTLGQTQFKSVAIQLYPEIFSFDVNWTDIQGLTPVIYSPYEGPWRNPKFKNAGRLVSLSEFLELAKSASTLSGVWIKIENAKYLAENKSMDIIQEVLDALEHAQYNSPTAKKVMIESTSSAVLKVFKGKKYELVYEVDDPIGPSRDFTNSTIRDIKTFSDSVAVDKSWFYPLNENGLSAVKQFQSINLSVYVTALRNEFMDIPYDFFADPVTEINSYAMGVGVDGLITDFPQTAAAYKKNHCLKREAIPIYMRPIQPQELILHIKSKPASPPPGISKPSKAPSPLPNFSPAPRPAMHRSCGIRTYYNIFGLLLALIIVN